MKKAPYFYELDTTQIKNAVVFLDVEGTLISEAGATPAELSIPEKLLDQRTIEAVGKLAGKNTVYLCSNSRNIPARRRLAGALGVVKYHESGFGKPDRAAVADILPTDGRMVVVIGDDFSTDGVLAMAIGAPCIRVRTLPPIRNTIRYRMARAWNDYFWYCFGFLIRPIASTGRITLLTHPPQKITAPVSALRAYLKRAQVHGFDIDVKILIKNLLKGFASLSVSYVLNPWEHQVSGTVCVLHGVDTLRWALNQKERGFIKKLIVGPEVFIAPLEEKKLLTNPLIDRLIVSSEWQKRWWISSDQLFESRVTVWASGVEDRDSGRNASGVCLVYSKNADEKVFQKIIEILWTYKLPIVVSRYGKFNDEEYHRLLSKAKMLVYLSEFSTNGSTLCDAWMADIPTLVWNRGYFEYQGRRFEDVEVGAPYMSAECGLTFTSDGDFERKLIEFLEQYNNFNPRKYASVRFTNEIAARKFLEIIGSY